MRLSGQRAALASLEVHHLISRPTAISLVMMLKHLLAAFAQHAQGDSEAAVGQFTARDGLKKKIYRCTAFQGGQLGSNVRQATSLRRNSIRLNQAVQSQKNCADSSHRVRGRIHTNDRVSTSVEQSLKRGQNDTANVVSRVIWLYADAQCSPLSHRVATARDVANPGRSKHQILVAHQLGCGCGDFRDDSALKLLYLNVSSSVVQQELSKLSDRHTCQRMERFLIESVQNKARNIVLGSIDQGTPDNFTKRHVGKFSFRGDPLSFRSCGNSSQLIARLFLVGFGKQFAEVGKVESLNHKVSSARDTMLSNMLSKRSERRATVLREIRAQRIWRRGRDSNPR